MLKIAIASSGLSLDSRIPALFAEASHLLIFDAEADTLLEIIDSDEADSLSRSMLFAQKVVDFDCEAILCGELEPEPFAVLAEENCITRYLAAECSVLESIHKMNAYALPLITDYIGGTGCPDNDPANCELDHDHDH